MVILMDATVATGAAAMMAIRVLLDHDVPEENILIVSLLMAESGTLTIRNDFSISETEDFIDLCSRRSPYYSVRFSASPYRYNRRRPGSKREILRTTRYW